MKRLNNYLTKNWQTYLLLTILLWLVNMPEAMAQLLDTAQLDAIKQEFQVVANTLWVIFTACLVFFMNAGFAMLESGFCRQKNTVNILTKNLIVFALSTVAFWSIGFGLMFGDGNPMFGTSGFFLGGADNSPSTGVAYQGTYKSLASAAIPLQAKFFFQLVFS